MNTFLKTIANSLPLAFEGKLSFYAFIQQQFTQYEIDLSHLPAEQLDLLLQESGELKGNPTKRRFINLISNIHKQCLSILADSYNGDLYSSLIKLTRLLTSSSAIGHRLKDVLANYFVLQLDPKLKLYRGRDEKEPIEDCWNLPFNLREKASNARFNLTGTICMYLASSADCCSLELGNHKPKQIRYIQEFRLKPNRHISLLDLRIPMDTEIDEMNAYEKFCFLLLYPFYCLCLSKAIYNHNDRSFYEEYLFSQLFFNMLFLQRNNDVLFFDGIIYSSVHDRSMQNIVLPARYDVRNNDDTNTKSAFLREHLEAIAPPFVYKQS